jgi:hypothetical protein
LANAEGGITSVAARALTDAKDREYHEHLLGLALQRSRAMNERLPATPEGNNIAMSRMYGDMRPTRDQVEAGLKTVRTILKAGGYAEPPKEDHAD